VLVKILEKRQAPVFQGGCAVFVNPVEAGDIVVDKFRDGGVLANDDEAGRNADFAFLPQLKIFA